MNTKNYRYTQNWHQNEGGGVYIDPEYAENSDYMIPPPFESTTRAKSASTITRDRRILSQRNNNTNHHHPHEQSYRKEGFREQYEHPVREVRGGGGGCREGGRGRGLKQSLLNETMRETVAKITRDMQLKVSKALQERDEVRSVPKYNWKP